MGSSAAAIRTTRGICDVGDRFRVCSMRPVLSASTRGGKKTAAGASPEFASQNKARKPSKGFGIDVWSSLAEESSVLCQQRGNFITRWQKVFAQRTGDANPSFVSQRQRGFRCWRVAAPGHRCKAIFDCSAGAQEIHLDARQGIVARSPTSRAGWHQGTFLVPASRSSAIAQRVKLGEPDGNFSRSPTPAALARMNSAGGIGGSECQFIR